MNATMDQRMPLSGVAAHARRAEELGYDGLDVPEAVHNGLVMAAVALGATTRLKVATSVLVAFPRSPMPDDPSADAEAAKVVRRLRTGS